MNKACTICRENIKFSLNYNSTHFNFLSEEKGKCNIFLERKILSCNSCGFSYVYPLISNKLLTDFYKNDYSAYGGPHYDPYQTSIYKWKNNINHRAMSQCLLARQYLDIVDDSNVLDIGCGFGENFSMLKKMGVNPNCFAIEAGENYTNRLLELGVSLLSTKDGGVELDKNYTGFFDIIFMSHVLEHFNANELETIVGNISKYLKDDGIFVCEVPNDDFRIRDLEGNNQAPHLSFFSIDSIRNLFNNRGLSINFISACGKVILTEKKSDLNIDITKKSFFGKLKCILYKNQFIKKTIRLIRYAAYNSIYSRYKYMIENKLNLLLLSNEFSYDVDRSKIRVVAHRIRANNE